MAAALLLALMALGSAPARADAARDMAGTGSGTAAGPGHAAQDPLVGTYHGLDAASGMTLDVRAGGGSGGDGLAGAITDARGNSYPFSSERDGARAAAVMRMEGRQVVLRLEARPSGIEAALVPLDAEGKPLPDQGRVMDFLRAGLDLPQPSKDYLPPPAPGTARITGLTFVGSYQYWPSEGVRDGYLALSDRNRTLIRLFAPVQLDVIWKLCGAKGADRAIGLAIRGEGVSCAEVDRVVAGTQRDGRFDDYKRIVDASLAKLREAIRCADPYAEAKAVCDRAGREVAAAAASLDTAGSVLARFR